MVLQFIPVSAILWIATAISLAAGTYCKQSNSIHFAHIWITILNLGTMLLAILHSLLFYKKHKELLKKHGIILKLVTFKGILALNFLQGVSYISILPNTPTGNTSSTRYTMLMLTLLPSTVHHLHPRRQRRPQANPIHDLPRREHRPRLPHPRLRNAPLRHHPHLRLLAPPLQSPGSPRCRPPQCTRRCNQYLRLAVGVCARAHEACAGPAKANSQAE